MECCLRMSAVAERSTPRRLTSSALLWPQPRRDARGAAMLRNPEHGRDRVAEPGLSKDSRRLGARGGRHGDDTP